MKHPPFETQRDYRAYVALWASIGGAIAFTLFAGALVLVLWLGGWAETTAVLRLGYLGKALLLALGGGLLVLVSLGFAINRRTLKLSRDGFEASGGPDDVLRTGDELKLEKVDAEQD